MDSTDRFWAEISELPLTPLGRAETLARIPLKRSPPDPELPVVNGSFRQFGAHGWQEPDGVRMRARRTARSAYTGR